MANIMSSKWNKKFPWHDMKIHLVAAGAGHATSAARQADWIWQVKRGDDG